MIGSSRIQQIRERIILTTIGSLGDLHPKVAIALELRQRGYGAIETTL